jgi:hypothetical protein
MSPNTTSTAILALDLGKHKATACLEEPASAQASFRMLSTGREELHRLAAMCPLAGTRLPASR